MYSQDIGYKQKGNIYDQCFSWSHPSSTNIASTAAYSYHWPPTMALGLCWPINDSTNIASTAAYSYHWPPTTALGLCWPINAVSFLQLYIHTIIHTQSQLKYPTMPAYTVITPASIEVDFTPWFPRHPKISKKAEVWPFRNLAATTLGAFGEICDQHMYIYIYVSIYRLHNTFQLSTSASKKDNSYDILDNLRFSRNLLESHYCCHFLSNTLGMFSVWMKPGSLPLIARF